MQQPALCPPRIGQPLAEGWHRDLHMSLRHAPTPSPPCWPAWLAAYAPLQREGRFPDAGPPGCSLDPAAFAPPPTLAGVARLEASLPPRALALNVQPPTLPLHTGGASSGVPGARISAHAVRKAAQARGDVEAIGRMLDQERAAAKGAAGSAADYWQQDQGERVLGASSPCGSLNSSSPGSVARMAVHARSGEGRAIIARAGVVAAHWCFACPCTGWGGRGRLNGTCAPVHIGRHTAPLPFPHTAAAVRPPTPEAAPLQPANSGVHAALVLLQKLLRGRAAQQVSGGCPGNGAQLVAWAAFAPQEDPKPAAWREWRMFGRVVGTVLLGRGQRQSARYGEMTLWRKTAWPTAHFSARPHTPACT